MTTRAIPVTMDLDEVESEILFTPGVLKGDPDAKDLLPLTDTWIPRLDDVRLVARVLRVAESETSAFRAVVDFRLDAAATAFGDEHFGAVAKDRESPRWRRYFHIPVSRFIRLGLADEVERVGGWLLEASDPVLENHREPLTTWSAAAGKALLDTRAVAGKRADLWTARHEHAESLTAHRDALYEALSARARERQLGRQWAGTFFRRESRPSGPGGGGNQGGGNGE